MGPEHWNACRKSLDSRLFMTSGRFSSDLWSRKLHGNGY